MKLSYQLKYIRLLFLDMHILRNVIFFTFYCGIQKSNKSLFLRTERKTVISASCEPSLGKLLFSKIKRESVGKTTIINWKGPEIQQFSIFLNCAIVVLSI